MEKTIPPPARDTTSRTANDEERLDLFVASAKGLTSISLPRVDAVLIGRDPSCDVVLPDLSVSRRHARLHLNAPLRIIDLGSTAGTFVAGTRVHSGEEATLSIGTPFELGSSTLVLQRARESGMAPHPAPSSGPLIPVVPTEAATDGAHPKPIVVDEAMRRAYGVLDTVAPTQLNVLVLGETGVGKEVFVAELHRKSLRANRAIVGLNCAALPESILESELFGYEKGAFTGANRSKQGLFEAADGGTLFLDEIGEMPLSTQAKILRVLETGEVLPIGSVKARKVDVRFVAATNRDLARAISEGNFRADLYFRLNGVSFLIPPLRKRRAEVGPLAIFFARRAATRLGRIPPSVSEATVRALETYEWPGNVRELRNVVERAVVLCTDTELRPEHLLIHGHDETTGSQGGFDFVSSEPGTVVERFPGPPRTQAPEGFGGPMRCDEPDEMATMGRIPILRPLGAIEEDGVESETADGLRDSASKLSDELKTVERERILRALARNGGNQSKAATELGISRHALIRRLDQFGIARPRKRGE
jgi:two-component system response regulator AtoC